MDVFQQEHSVTYFSKLFHPYLISANNKNIIHCIIIQEYYSLRYYTMFLLENTLCI